MSTARKQKRQLRNGSKKVSRWSFFDVNLVEIEKIVSYKNELIFERFEDLIKQ
jgi:hypothetical protein